MARTVATIEAELSKVESAHTAAAEQTAKLANQRMLLIRELEATRAEPADEPTDEPPASTET